MAPVLCVTSAHSFCFNLPCAASELIKMPQVNSQHSDSLAVAPPNFPETAVLDADLLTCAVCMSSYGCDITTMMSHVMPGCGHHFCCGCTTNIFQKVGSAKITRQTLVWWWKTFKIANLRAGCGEKLNGMLPTAQVSGLRDGQWWSITQWMLRQICTGLCRGGQNAASQSTRCHYLLLWFA